MGWKAKTWGWVNSRPLEEEQEEGAQQGWLCFKDRHSTFSHREESRSTFADCTMDWRALACSDHSWHHREQGDGGEEAMGSEQWS